MARKGTTKYLSLKQEKATAKELGGWRTPCSGALPAFPGDVQADGLLVECKITDKPFYRLTLATWEKIRREATASGLRIPLMKIGLLNGKIEMAVFEAGAFDHYRLFRELRATIGGDYKVTAGKSARIEGKGERIFIDCGGSNSSFDAMEWKLFLEILRGGIGE
jgi:hypothetical protein